MSTSVPWRTRKPSVALDLTVSEAAVDNLSWTEPAVKGAVSIVYDVVRSTDPSDFSGAACIETGDSDTLATDAALPLSGELYCYLVQPRNGCGATLGTNSAGARPTVTCP